jgi:hypothetical protein
VAVANAIIAHAPRASASRCETTSSGTTCASRSSRRSATAAGVPLSSRQTANSAMASALLNQRRLGHRLVRVARQLLVAAAVDLAAKLDPTMAPHLEALRLDAPNLLEPNGSPEALARFVRLKDGQADSLGTRRRGQVLDRSVD